MLDESVMRQAIVMRSGDVLPGGYVLGPQLGIGGMGTVYAAHTRHGRAVVVKVAHTARNGDHEAIRCLRRELVAGRRIHHANVVQIFDYGDVAGGAFIVMERVPGVLLGDLIETEGTLDVPRVLSIARAILAGLTAIHAAGFVHADIKSDNVLVETTRDGSLRVMIIDLGLARRFGDALAECCDDGSRLMSGTPEYMAPEVILGAAATASADLYAVGVILYEMLTGVTPFAGGASSDILARHLDEAAIPPSLRLVDRAVPALLELAILRALQKDPADRFATAAGFLEALARAPSTDEARVTATAEPSRVTRNVETPTVVTSVPRTLLAAGSQSRADLRIAMLREEVAAAMRRSAHDVAVAGTLEIARTLVGRKSLSEARSELEDAVHALTNGHGIDADEAPRPMWRLLLTLSALYSGLHDPVRARCTALAAHRQATRHRSDLGRDRAAALLHRLSRS